MARRVRDTGGLLQVIAVTKPLYGGWVVFPLLAPLGVAQLLLIGWLLWKGLHTSEV